MPDQGDQLTCLFRQINDHYRMTLLPREKQSRQFADPADQYVLSHDKTAGYAIHCKSGANNFTLQQRIRHTRALI
jgi:hypothetical protein